MAETVEHRLAATAYVPHIRATCACGASFGAYGTKGALNQLNDHILEAEAEEIRFIELEMAYTPYLGSCREPAVTPTGSLRQCRRAMRHPGRCASGHGRSLYLWMR